MDFTKLAPQETVEKVRKALDAHGITSDFVKTAKDALEKVLETVPSGAEVLTMVSITLEETGIAEEINTSGKYISIKKKLSGMNRETDGEKMQQLGAAPQWALGSAHAVTEDGVIIVASNTGSQLPAYAYGSGHVVLVVSTKKIVRDYAQGMERIREHIVPLETKRVRKAYGLPDTFHTFPSKILVINREVNKGRIHVVFVGEDLGF